jgi:hypothetical protein
MAAAALAAASFVFAAAPAQAAGLWETLFGATPRPALAPMPQSDPLHMTVRPKRKKDPAKLDGTAKDGPATPLAKPMEYANDPFWYLKDETLKKGDIVVLKDRVVVFGGGERAYANFAAFQSSRLLSDRAKSQLRYLVSAPKDNSTIWEPVKAIGERNLTTAAELSERTR